MSRRRILLDNNNNVNGVPLTLQVCSDAKSNMTTFIVSYKVNEQRTNWPKLSLVLGILFNMLALCTLKISLYTVLLSAIVLSFLSLFWVTHSVQTESLMVIPTVGIQSSVKYVLGKEENFVSWPQIDDIIINEVISMWSVFLTNHLIALVCTIGAFLTSSLNQVITNRVLHFLTVLVKKNSNQHEEGIKLLPLFKHTKPRLLVLELIYNELQNMLMKTQEDKSKMASGDKNANN